jgi:hypothetical protein
MHEVLGEMDRGAESYFTFSEARSDQGPLTEMQESKGGRPCSGTGLLVAHEYWFPGMVFPLIPAPNRL